MSKTDSCKVKRELYSFEPSVLCSIMELVKEMCDKYLQYDLVFRFKVRDIHSRVPPAAEMVGDRLRDAESNRAAVEKDKKEALEAYEAWQMGWAKDSGKEPTKEER